MFIQFIDTALAALHCAAHHRLYVSHMELSAAQQQNLFVELGYSSLDAATTRLDVPGLFQDLGYIAPTKAKLCIPHQFVPPGIRSQNVTAAKPKPKPKLAAQQLLMAASLAQK